MQVPRLLSICLLRSVSCPPPATLPFPPSSSSHQLFTPPPPSPPPLPLSSPNLSKLLLNTHWASPKLCNTCKCMQSNGEIASGQLWRFLTPAILHGNLVHLCSNSLALNSVGPMVERESGSQRFLAVYAISAVSSAAASCLQPNPSIGSSGNVYVAIHARSEVKRYRQVHGQACHFTCAFVTLTYDFDCIKTACL